LVNWISTGEQPVAEAKKRSLAGFPKPYINEVKELPNIIKYLKNDFRRDKLLDFFSDVKDVKRENMCDKTRKHR